MGFNSGFKGLMSDLRHVSALQGPSPGTRIYKNVEEDTYKTVNFISQRPYSFTGMCKV